MPGKPLRWLSSVFSSVTATPEACADALLNALPDALAAELRLGAEVRVALFRRGPRVYVRLALVGDDMEWLDVAVADLSDGGTASRLSSLRRACEHLGWRPPSSERMERLKRWGTAWNES